MKSSLIRLEMAMAWNSLFPSETAFEAATRSAQMPTVYAAFSMLHPVDAEGSYQGIKG